MDPVTGAILGKAGEQITESLFQFMRSQIGYVVHCNQNIKKLRAELENLRAEMETVQGRVNRARDNAEEIEPNVSKWLSDVGDVVKEMDHFLAADMGSLLKCCNGCCPNIGSRRRLGKEAEDKLMDVLKLREGGKFDSVGHQAPQIDTHLFKSTADSQHFESRVSVFDQIMDALKDDSVYTIGIYGMAGVGKTTMVNQVFKQAKDMKLFDDFAKAVVSQTPDYAKIQRDLAACLNLTLPKESQVQDASLLCSRLKNGKKILLIIDDIWDAIELEEIGIPSKDYIRGSKILFTSRIQDVYVQMDIQKQFQIGVLSKSEAWSLFKNKVGNTIDDSNELRSVAEEVCRECGGLPLAIVTLGAALKKKKLQVWNDSLNQLKSCRGNYIKGMTDRVYRSIELSYEFLEHTDTKACFLYCCLYGEDAEICIEDLVQHGVGRRFLSGWETVEAARQRVSTIVDTLKTSCLLLEGENESFVKMHDIVRDIATSIAARDIKLKLLVRSGGVQQWPEVEELECCRTLSSTKCMRKEPPTVLECPELRTLVLLEASYDFIVPQSFFKVTKKLEVLYLRGLVLLASAASISELTNIRILHIFDCKLENLSFLKELKELVMLRINYCKIVALTSEVEKLTQLRVLDLRGCYRLKAISTGIVSSLSRLEELYLPDEFDEWESEGNARLDELNSLHYLHILHIHLPDAANAKALLSHESWCWSLIKFRISVGGHFDELDRHPDTGYVRALKLDGIDLIGEPMVLMKKAEALVLTGLKGLQKVFENRQGEPFSDLKFLKVKNCDDEMGHGFLLGKPKWNNPQVIQEAKGPRTFCKLRVLKVSDCRLKYLFSRPVAGGLLRLQELKVSNCRFMEEIVGDEDTDSDEQVGNEVLVFSQLKILELKSLPNLKSFYASTKIRPIAESLFNQKVSFPALEELSLDRLANVAAVWGIQFGAPAFPPLQYLTVSSCEKLVNLIVSFAHPEFQDRQQAEQDIVILPKLESIRLKHLQNIKSFCSFKSNEEEMEEDKNLQVNAFFSHKVKLPCLKILSLDFIPLLREIWDVNVSTDTFDTLEQINIAFCDELAYVAPSKFIKIFHGLRELNIKKCPNLEEILGSVEASNEIEEGPSNEIESNLLFPQLNYVNFYDLPKLRSIYSKCSTAKVLSAVTWLRIERCSILEKELATATSEEKPESSNRFLDN